MNQFKRAKAVVLATDKPSIMYKELDGKLRAILKLQDFKFTTNYNMYITSDDKIKEGDYILHIKKNIFEKVYFHIDIDKLSRHWKKIIATTDTSLTITYFNKGTWDYLPQPSQQFIEKYIESYNKGEVITEVLIEYNYVMCPNEPKCINCYSKCLIGNKLKINPKDNTITIKKLKDNWNRKEAIQLLKDFELKIQQSMDSDDDGNTFTNVNIENWIKENL